MAGGKAFDLFSLVFFYRYNSEDLDSESVGALMGIFLVTISWSMQHVMKYTGECVFMAFDNTYDGSLCRFTDEDLDSEVVGPPIRSCFVAILLCAC